MKKINKILVCVLALISLAYFGIANAQNETEIPPEKKLTASIQVDRSILVGDKTIFNSSKSIIPESKNQAIYTWDFGNGAYSNEPNPVYTYNSSGDYTVKLTVKQGKETASEEISVKVFEHLIILINDGSADENIMKELARFANTKGVLLENIEDKSGQPDYVVLEKLSQNLQNFSDEISKAEIIIDYTSGSLGLNALSKFVQTIEDTSNLGLEQKVIVTATTNSAVLARSAQSTFDIVRPQYILLVNPNSLHAVIEAQSADNVFESVKDNFGDYRLIGVHSERSIKKLGVTNFMTYVVNFMANRGVPMNTIYLILILPVIATLVSVARQVVGIKAFGIYIATIITLAFIVTGIKYGLIILGIILATSVLARLIMKKFKLLYLPRMAIVMTIMGLVIFAMFAVGAYTHRTGFLSISIFPILIITMLAEKFVEEQIREGMKNAILLSIFTLLISVAAYFLVSWDSFRTLVLSYPEIILLTVVINIALGRFTGLRLTEYFRFRIARKSH